MPKKLMNILNKESVGVNEAAILLGALTLLSLLLGLFRDKALAHFIGPGATLDIYYAAFRIPDFLYASIGSLVSITIHIPFLLEKMKQSKDGDNSAAIKFLSDVFTGFLILMSGVALIAFIFMPAISHFVAPGFGAFDRSQLIMISRIMLVSPILLGLSNLLGTVTQLFKKFFVYSLSPVLYNLGIIVGVVFFYPMWGIKGLAFGVILGSIMHLLIQIPVVISKGFMPRLTRHINVAETKRVMLISLPRTIALSLNNFSVLVILSIASLLGAGAISIFNFSYNLQSIPLSIIGVSYSVAAFPTLARFFSGGETARFTEHVIDAARQIVFWSMPIVFLFIVLRAQIVRVILGSGSFSWADTKLVAAALALFSLSIVAQSLNLLFVRAYYAAGKTKKPLSINFIFSVAIIALALGFVWLFKHVVGVQYFIESLLRVSNIAGTSILVLPLAYSIGTIGNTFALWRGFKRDFGEQTSFKRTFLQSLTAALAMGVVSYFMLALLDNVFDINTFLGIFAQGFLAGIAGIAVWVTVLRLLKNTELDDFWIAVCHKFWKTPIIAPEQADLVK
jgi:putative peptidoglycan lipid II flippase